MTIPNVTGVLSEESGDSRRGSSGLRVRGEFGPDRGEDQGPNRRTAHSTVKNGLYLRFRTLEKKNPAKSRGTTEERRIAGQVYRNVGL